MYAYPIENTPLNKIIFLFQEQGEALISKGEFLSLAENLTAAFTGFFLEKRNSQPCTDWSPSTQQWDKQPHTQIGYTQHLHLGTELLHGCTRQAAGRIPREDPGLYIVSVQIHRGHELASGLRHRARSTSCKRPDKTFAVLRTGSISNTQTPSSLKLKRGESNFGCVFTH